MIRILVLCAVLAGASAGQAQSTGRHRPVSAPVDTVAAAAPTRWHVALNLGFASAGDLFRARAGGTVPWTPEGGAPFSSREFMATLDEGFAYGISARRDISAWFSLRADAEFTELPVTAAARVGETVRVYEYDNLSLTSFTLGVEARLARSASYLYLTAAAGATVADAAGGDAYDQTALAARFGGGWHQALNPALACRLEICNTLQSIELEDYRPPTSRSLYPDVTIENQAPQSILRLQAALVASF